MKTYTKYLLLLFVIMIIFLPRSLFSQQENRIKELSIEGGAMIDPDMGSGEFDWSAYIAPALRISRHEFYIGPLLALGPTIRSSDVVWGGIAGYKFSILKKPSRINLYAHYSLRYYKNSGVRHYYQFWQYRIVTEEWKQDNCVNTFGFGFNFFFDNKRRYGFFSELGYSIDAMPTHYKPHVYVDWNHVNAALGLNVKIFSFSK
jgi:hypothetical protein